MRIRKRILSSQALKFLRPLRIQLLQYDNIGPVLPDISNAQAVLTIALVDIHQHQLESAPAYLGRISRSLTGSKDWQIDQHSSQRNSRAHPLPKGNTRDHERDRADEVLHSEMTDELKILRPKRQGGDHAQQKQDVCRDGEPNAH
jgi:hypothetical protein